MSAECEACGRSSAVHEVAVALVEVAGIGGHPLCVDCLRALMLDERMIESRAVTVVARMYEDVLVRQLAQSPLGVKPTEDSLMTCARRGLRAQIAHYHDCMNWIAQRRKSHGIGDEDDRDDRGD